MNHWIVVPIVLPALCAAALVLLRGRLAWQRLVSTAATLALLAVAIGLAIEAAEGAYWRYMLGDWPPPFGIVLVLDRLAALMLLLTAIVAMASVAYAVTGSDKQGPHFHVLFQFQLVGLNGAFLTGDLFNLFVFFEVLLIASYGLLLHGRGAPRIRAAVHYVVLNLFGSALFLLGVGLLYAMTGTLNMADLAVRVASASGADAALIRSGGLLLLVVFGLKAALVPLYFWLPATYAAASAPVAALFVIVTKVGVYAILRLATVVFGIDGRAATGIIEWLLPAGLLTLALATLGALAARSLKRLAAYATIASVGTLAVGIALFDEAAISAALYYLVHSTLVIALLFLVAEMIARGRGLAADRLDAAAAVAQPRLLGGLFFAASVGIVGLPPLAGFLGKLLLLEAAQRATAAAWIWTALLLNALLMLIALSRAGSTLFWKTLSPPAATCGRAARSAEALPALALLACIVALTIVAGPVTRYTGDASAQLLDPAGYVEAVLGGPFERLRGQR